MKVTGADLVGYLVSPKFVFPSLPQSGASHTPDDVSGVGRSVSGVGGITVLPRRGGTPVQPEEQSGWLLHTEQWPGGPRPRGRQGAS